MARTADRLLQSGLCLMAAAATWLGIRAADPTGPTDPQMLLTLAEPADRAGLRQLVDGCTMADAASVHSLQQLAASPDPAVAGNAIRALGRLQAVERDPATAARLDDPRQRVRLETIAALGNSNSNDSVRLLVPLLHDDDRQVRLLTIQSLARLGATDALNRLAADPATDAETRTFIRAATRPVLAPRLLASTAGVVTR